MVPLEHPMTLTETLPHKKRPPIKFRYILTQELTRKCLTSHEMQRQQTAAAKSACLWIKIFYFHLLAKHHLATHGSHPNTCYARWTDQRGLLTGVRLPLQSFGESFQDFQHFLLVLHLQMPSTAVGDPCALWPFTRSEIWVVFLLHHSLYASETREMLLSRCCMWAWRASLGQ